MPLLICAPMRLSDYQYELPDKLIARYPAEERRASRLLLVDCDADRLTDRRFSDLPSLLQPGDLLVFNDTRVIKARLRGRKESGGKVEILVERISGTHSCLAHVRASKMPKPGARLLFANECTATVVSRDADLFELEFSAPLAAYLEVNGEIPLPPYLNRAAEPVDDDRYQTVYARQSGAVAAPTAGLHFDTEMLFETLSIGVRHCFVTLHVGAGTFQSLREEQVEANRLHSERVEVTDAVASAVRQTRAAGGRVIAVGTTAVRALEAATINGRLEAWRGETDLFIRPGYRFQSVDALLTNFHLPRSSLLMLVAAMAGTRKILHAYRHAVDNEYRFFSYGDAMLILPGPRAP
jgi:S-adenosylmethionine:tRNA ribosyltransferase-isomerase